MKKYLVKAIRSTDTFEPFRESESYFFTIEDVHNAVKELEGKFEKFRVYELKEIIDGK